MEEVTNEVLYKRIEHVCMFIGGLFRLTYETTDRYEVVLTRLPYGFGFEVAFFAGGYGESEVIWSSE